MQIMYLPAYLLHYVVNSFRERPMSHLFVHLQDFEVVDIEHFLEE